MKLEDILHNRRVNIPVLAVRMDYSPTYVRAIVNGQFKPGKRFLEALDKVVEDEEVVRPKSKIHRRNTSFTVDEFLEFMQAKQILSQIKE